MEKVFKATKISDHAYWVGAVDWNIRDFHGYAVRRGSTYNAYLILADKITLIDTVKAPFREEMFSRITSVIAPGDISYVVSNHSEMDHSGCLPEAIAAIEPEKVFASRVGAKTLSEHFHLDSEIIPLKDGDNVSLGNLSLSFLETKMLHWPDSMCAYLNEDCLLFSQDAFGMHLASGERFADEIDDDDLEYEAARYYANILLPFSSLVTKLLEKVSKLGIKIDILAPDHGPIWRKDISRMPDFYSKWAEQRPTKKAVIMYDTMWKSTASMARAIAEGLVDGGASPKLMQLGASHRSDVVTELLDAGALIVGSPTMNSNMFPTVADALTYIKGLKPKNLIGATFGSYGWSGEAMGQVKDMLDAMKIDIVGEGVRTRYVPDDNALEQCFSLGSLVAAELNRRCDGEE